MSALLKRSDEDCKILKKVKGGKKKKYIEKTSEK